MCQINLFYSLWQKKRREPICANKRTSTVIFKIIMYLKTEDTRIIFKLSQEEKPLKTYLYRSGTLYQRREGEEVYLQEQS